MLRTWRIFHFGGWWFSERAVPFCTCAEVWTATERSWWNWIVGQRAGDEVKSARWLWFTTRVSAMRTCLCVLGFQSHDSECTWIKGLLKPRAVLSQTPQTLPDVPSTLTGDCCSGWQGTVLKKRSLERNESSTRLFHTFWLLWFSLVLNLSLLSHFPFAPRGLPDLAIHPQFPCYCHLTDEKYVIIQHIIKTARANEGEIWKVFIENL